MSAHNYPDGVNKTQLVSGSNYAFSITNNLLLTSVLSETLSKLTRGPTGGGQQANLHSERPQPNRIHLALDINYSYLNKDFPVDRLLSAAASVCLRSLFLRIFIVVCFFFYIQQFLHNRFDGWSKSYVLPDPTTKPQKLNRCFIRF